MLSSYVHVHVFMYFMYVLCLYYVCLYVCMYVLCMYVVCMYVWLTVCMYVCMYICIMMYVCMYVCIMCRSAWTNSTKNCCLSFLSGRFGCRIGAPIMGTFISSPNPSLLTVKYAVIGGHPASCNSRGGRQVCTPVGGRRRTVNNVLRSGSMVAGYAAQ